MRLSIFIVLLTLHLSIYRFADRASQYIYRFPDRASQYIYRFADRASQYIYLSN